MTVYFIGAGPGDPDLITVKGQKLINHCPIILYAGSLVPREIFSDVENSAEKIIDTAAIDLGQIIMGALSKKGGAGIGLALGIFVSFMCLAVDNLIQTWANERKKLLGIE